MKNPYSLNPVSGSEEFLGYQKDLQNVVQGIIKGRSFIIFGGNGMGKTSMLRRVEQQLREQSLKSLDDDYNQIIIPLYLDMLSFNFTHETFFILAADMLASYLDQLSLPFDVSSAKSALQSVSTYPESSVGFVAAVDQLCKASQSTSLKIAFLLDDFWHKRHQEIPFLSARLRAVLSAFPQEQTVTYVISGTFQDFTQLKDSPLENILRRYYLHVFNEEESLALINEPTQNKIPPEVAHLVYRETGGHPFLLQYMMSTLWEYHNWSHLTAKEVAQATERFQEQYSGFNLWWHDLSDIDRRVYDVLCQTDGSVSLDDLTDMLMLRYPQEDVKRPAIRNSLRALGTEGLIQEIGKSRDGTYAIAGQWPARWFRQIEAEKGEQP